MIKFLSSSRITVVCLFLLFILTFWGTIAQVQQGLYAAQDRFFNSYLFSGRRIYPFSRRAIGALGVFCQFDLHDDPDL